MVRQEIMNMRKLVISLTGIIFLALSGASVSASEEKDTDAGALFESKCSLCHNISRPKSKKKSAEGWRSTVMRMKNKNGCPINDEEAETIINYLTDNYGK